jgi:hypothetical protein
VSATVVSSPVLASGTNPGSLLGAQRYQLARRDAEILLSDTA